VRKEEKPGGKIFWYRAEKMAPEESDEIPASAGVDDDDEVVAPQNPITRFFTGLRGAPKEDFDDISADEPEIGVTLGRNEKKVLALLKKSVDDDLEADDIAMRLKKGEDEIQASLDVLFAEGMVEKKSGANDKVFWSASII
jgi:hypothetical protein